MESFGGEDLGYSCPLISSSICHFQQYTILCDAIEEISEGSPKGTRNTMVWRKEYVKEMRFKSRVKGRGSDR